VAFVYFTLIARILGAQNTGDYFFAMSFALIFTVVADFGLTPVLTREISKFPDKAQKYFNSVFTIKILFGLFAYVAMILFAKLLNYSEIRTELIYLSGLTVFFDNISSSAYAYLRAKRNLVYESITIASVQTFTLLFGSLALYLGWPIHFLIVAYVVPSFLNSILVHLFIKTKYLVKYKLVFDKNILKLFLGISLPFALAGIINRFYSYTDTLIMSKILTENELGWWSVPYKIIFAFQFIPSALTISIFPVMSNLYVSNKEKVAVLFEKSFRYLLLLSLPMSFGIFVISEPVILKLYGPEYIPSIIALKILSFSLVFVFASYLTGTLLNSINKQKIQTGLVFCAWILSIIFNLIFIPIFGIYGAAVTLVATNAVLFGLGFYFVNKFVGLNLKHILKIFNQFFWPSLLMFFVVIVVLKINLILAIFSGIFVYFVTLYFKGVLNKEVLKNNFLKIK